MKRIVFVVSHVGAGAETFITQVLNENPRLDILMTGRSYEHPSDLDALFVYPHKLNNTAAIYGDLLLHNINFSCPSLHKICKFIYIIREAKPSLNENLMHPRKYQEAYYRFRLRRMYEMARNTPGAVFLTWDDMRSGRGNGLIEEYLSLKESLVKRSEIFPISIKDRISFDEIARCQDVYEKYFFKMRSLNLRQV